MRTVSLLILLLVCSPCHADVLVKLTPQQQAWAYRTMRGLIGLEVLCSPECVDTASAVARALATAQPIAEKQEDEKRNDDPSGGHP